MKFSALAVSTLALSAFLAGVPALAQDNRVDAGGMPTTHSTPDEHAATADLNNTVTNTNVAADQSARRVIECRSVPCRCARYGVDAFDGIKGVRCPD